MVVSFLNPVATENWLEDSFKPQLLDTIQTEIDYFVLDALFNPERTDLDEVKIELIKALEGL